MKWSLELCRNWIGWLEYHQFFMKVKKDVFIKLIIYLIVTLFFVGKNVISRLMQQWKFPSIHVASNVSTNYYFFFRNIIVNQLCWFWCNILSLKLLCTLMQILSFISHFMRLNARCSWNFTSLQYLNFMCGNH